MPIASQTRRLGEAEKNLKGARECIARHFVAFATKECKWQRLTSNLRTQSNTSAQFFVVSYQFRVCLEAQLTNNVELKNKEKDLNNPLGLFKKR